LANLRLQLDEHIGNAIARGLRRAGFDVMTTADAGLLGASDAVQLAHAHAEGRVMVTQDDDFIGLHYQGVPHSGITYSPRDSRSIGVIIEMLTIVDATYEPADMVGRLEYI
jgi:uncharacterized protein with PIN domain